MIKQIVFDDINQSEIDTSEVEKKLAIDLKIDTSEVEKKMALDIKNGLGLMRLNKTIKQIIFDDINQIKIDTSEVEKKIALDIKDGLGVKINSQNKMKEFICDFLISCANEK